MQKIDDYLKIKDAATWLGVSPTTLRNWERQGKLKAHRNPVNRYRLYKKSDLEELLIKIRYSAESTDKNSRG
jgi:MerR family transcriptional regulator, copper efflux regulator